MVENNLHISHGGELARATLNEVVSASPDVRFELTFSLVRLVQCARRTACTRRDSDLVKEAL